MPDTVTYASDSTSLGSANALETLIVHTKPDFGPHGDGIVNTNALFALLKMKGKMDVVDGGLEFWGPALKRENSNFKWQSPTTSMSADLQFPNETLRFPIKVFTGSIVINELHKAMASGRAMIKQLADSLTVQAESTIPNSFNSAFWNTSPGVAEPESIPNMISATPTAGTIGGLTRSTGDHLQNGAYTTAVADVGSEAGVATLYRMRLRYAIGSGGKDGSDIAVMSDNNFSGLQGYLLSQNRYTADQKMLDLNFDTIKIGGMTIYPENTNVKGGANSINEKYVYGINSRYFKFKALKLGNFKWADEGFVRVGETLSKAYYFYVFCNLWTNLPAAHWVMTNVSTT